MGANAAAMTVSKAVADAERASVDGRRDEECTDASVVTVLVVDDHPVLREGLREVLERTGRIRVTGEADNIADAMTRIRIIRPQVVVIDLHLPDGNGTELCAHVRSTYSEIGVLVLTSSVSDQALFSSIEAGANGFMLKNSRVDRIIEAIETVARGGSWLDHAVAGRVLHKLREPTPAEDDHLRSLTSTEREVLSHLAAGRSNREIATRVCLSESAVKKHVTAMMRKIGVQSRTEAAVFALRHGLEPSDRN